jgi:thiosulfate dehydrogenase
LNEATMFSKGAIFLASASALIYAAISLPFCALAQQNPAHDVPAPAHGGTVVMLCDGKTSIEVKDLKPGQTMTHAEAQAVSNALMAKWMKAHPGERWEMAQENTSGGPASAQQIAPSAAAAASAEATPAVQQGDTYASFQPRDYKVWQAETDNFVAQGKKIFHDAKLLGSTIAVSCDMCHPDASNTHPETYPKYQVQLQKVALLRDMIDWCIENPIKGKALDPNDPKLRALEAYIYAQRKGVPLDYGKH